MERLTLDDMIKALRCVASHDAAGECYADHENFMHMADDEYKSIVCGTGEDLRDHVSGKKAVGCPYYQDTYGCCFEDGESYWLKDVAELLEELKSYKEAEEQGLLMRLPCKVGDTVWVVTSPINVFDECDEAAEYEVYESYLSSVTYYTCGEQFRINAKVTNSFIVEYFRECDFGKTVFLTREEAEKMLEEMKK